MPIPGPGVAISMQTIVNEFGGTAPHSLSEYYRGGGLVPNTPTNAAIPTSGAISMGDFYGSANRSTVSLVISGDVQNYDVYDNRGPSYVAGNTDLTVTVNPGVVVGSASTGSFAMLVPSAFSPSDTVTIVNNGTIIGRGGNGGNGGNGGPPKSAIVPGTPGAGGGSGLYVNRPTIVTNNGTLAGGGGGGGGGGGTRSTLGPGRRSGGGGGGGAGFNGGTGGNAGGGTPGSSPGSPGTTAAGGAGGSGTFGGVPGGVGGGQGASGLPGVAAGPVGAGSGAGPGNYITGNPFVTYPATGTRLGGVA